MVTAKPQIAGTSTNRAILAVEGWPLCARYRSAIFQTTHQVGHLFASASFSRRRHSHAATIQAVANFRGRRSGWW